MFANRLNWTPDQVDAQDPEFIDQMTAYFAAQAAHDDEQAKKAKKPKPGKPARPGHRR